MVIWQPDNSFDVHAIALPMSQSPAASEFTHAVQSSLSSTQVSCTTAVTPQVESVIKAHVARQRRESVATMTLRVWPTRHLAINFGYWWKGSEILGARGILETDFSHRQPVMFESEIVSSDPLGGTISLTREQEILDLQLQAFAAAGFNGLAHNWYPFGALMHLDDHPTELYHDHLARPWQRYQQSVFKSLLKWCWIFDSGWCYTEAVRLERFLWLAASVDEQYFRVHYNRPVFFVFDSQQPGKLWTPESTALLRSCFLAAGKGNPYIVSMGLNTTEARAKGMDGLSAYGPLDIVISGTAEGRKYSSHAATARARTQFVATDLQAVPAPPVFGDQRPYKGYATAWADPPVTTELIAELQACETWLRDHPTNAIGNFTLVYSATELSEYGGIIPTTQNDVHATGLGFPLDAFAHVTGKAVRTWVWNSCNPYNSTFCNHSGWTVSTAVVGAYDSSVLSEDTPGGWHTFTASSKVSGIAQLYGDKGPAHGVAAVTVDGGAAVLCDCYAPTLQHRQLLFESGLLSAGVHVIRTEVSNAPNPLSTGTLISLDECKIQAAV